MCAFFVVETIATYNALLGRDWIHSSWCVPSTLHQKLIFWNGGRTEVVTADDKPFVASTNAVEARYYDEDIGTIRFFRMDRYGRPSGITACTRFAMDRQTVKEVSEVVYEGEEEDLKDQITLEELDLAPAKLDDLKVEVQDPLEEVNLGTEADPRITFISGSLEPCLHDKIITILHEYKDCFAWDYSEMPGLDKNLVERRLPIRPDFKPFKQPPRRMSSEVTLKVKEEIEQLLKVGFIRTSRYVEWLSNVVPVVKKNGKLRIYVNFRNLNLATPKDEYPMPIADLLVDGAARHRILSFMDGHSGYNQIFIAEEDIPKTTFRYPGAIGTYEWVVMPFGLKNAGATYQRAMNAIFHDMIGRFMEISIDDVVVKSNEDEEHLEHLKLAFERMRKHGLKMNPLKCAFGVSTGNFLGYLVHERGLEVDQNKARAVIEAQPPRRKTRVFSPLLKLKSEVDFKWEKHHQTAFEEIKHYLSKPPVLVPPLRGKPLILYISATDESVGRIGKWVLALSEFNLKYMPQKAVKGQALADFLADHSCLEVEADEEKDLNIEANEMAQIASGLKIPEGVMSRIVAVEKRILPSIHMRGMAISACSIDIAQTDWRYPIMEYLKNPNFKASRRTKMQALNFVLLEGVLYRRGHDELLLRCLGPDEYCQIMSDVHNGICGAHQAGIKMRWLIRRHGFFWPSILKDCISYAKGCKACQIHGPLQRVPASKLHPIVKPWPFRGWAIDLIGKVYPPSTRGHSFIIVATDYFTKWVEAKPMKKVDQTDIIKFLKEEIIHRFGLPETVTSDQGTVFVGAQVEAFAKEMGFRLLTSTPHYAQANGQVEASNRIVINPLEKMVDDNPRCWHELLSDTIWAYRTSQRSSTKATPFSLTYGHDVVLPMELSARSLRIAIQHGLTSGEYNEAIILELEDLEGMRLTALDRLQTQKLKVARAYNK
ncbi:hypothetical protein SLEP1_g26087 [Rubroshorea leprosula]|nr:hypothetical protein SLEP1_g26087 [Rubroshorea leprosula]